MMQSVKRRYGFNVREGSRDIGWPFFVELLVVFAFMAAANGMIPAWPVTDILAPAYAGFFVVLATGATYMDYSRRVSSKRYVIFIGSMLASGWRPAGMAFRIASTLVPAVLVMASYAAGAHVASCVMAAGCVVHKVLNSVHDGDIHRVYLRILEDQNRERNDGRRD